MLHRVSTLHGGHGSILVSTHFAKDVYNGVAAYGRGVIPSNKSRGDTCSFVNAGEEEQVHAYKKQVRTCAGTVQDFLHNKTKES